MAKWTQYLPSRKNALLGALSLVIGVLLVLVIVNIGKLIPSQSPFAEYKAKQEVKAPAPQAPAGKFETQTNDGNTIIVDTTNYSEELAKIRTADKAEAEKRLAEALEKQRAAMQAEIEKLRNERSKPANQQHIARYDNVMKIFGEPKVVRTEPVVSQPAAPQAAPANRDNPASRGIEDANRRNEQPQAAPFDGRFKGAQLPPLEQWDSVKDLAVRVAMVEKVCGGDVGFPKGYSEEQKQKFFSGMNYATLMSSLNKGCRSGVQEAAAEDQRSVQVAGNARVDLGVRVAAPAPGYYRSRAGAQPESMYEGDVQLMRLNSLGPRGRVVEGGTPPQGAIPCIVKGVRGMCVPK